MSYQAQKHYQQEDVVNSYDEKRFTSLKGKIIEHRENKTVTKIIKQLDLKDLIADVPVGTGRFIELFKKHNLNSIGIDISLPMLKKTKSHQKNSELFKGALQAQIEQLPLKNNSVDLLFVFRLFQHLPDKQKETVLNECHRVTRSHVCISFAETYSLSNLWRTVYTKVINKERHPISQHKLNDLLTQTGFQKIKCYRVLPLLSGEKVLLAKKI